MPRLRGNLGRLSICMVVIGLSGGLLSSCQNFTKSVAHAQPLMGPPMSSAVGHSLVPALSPVAKEMLRASDSSGSFGFRRTFSAMERLQIRHATLHVPAE